MDEILKILERDGKRNLELIAKKTGKSLEEVTRVINQYEEDGTIVRYKAVLNEDKLIEKQKTIRALIEVHIRPQKDRGFDGIAQKIYKFPEVKSCQLVSGSFDLLIEVEADDIQTISSFVAQKLSLTENVQSTTTHFLLKKYKVDGDILVTHNDDERLKFTP